MNGEDIVSWTHVATQHNTHTFNINEMKYSNQFDWVIEIISIITFREPHFDVGGLLLLLLLLLLPSLF